MTYDYRTAATLISFPANKGITKKRLETALVDVLDQVDQHARAKAENEGLPEPKSRYFELVDDVHALLTSSSNTHDRLVHIADLLHDAQCKTAFDDSSDFAADVIVTRNFPNDVTIIADDEGTYGTIYITTWQAYLQHAQKQGRAIGRPR